METRLNKILLRQIKKHFGTSDNGPAEFTAILNDISKTYESFEDDARLLQNSIEISSAELREAFRKHKEDAELRKETIEKISEAISALNPAATNISSAQGKSSSDSSDLINSLITLIEARNQAEVEILKLSKAVEQSPVSIVITALNGDIEYVNPKFCDITGYTKEEAIGQNPRLLKSENSPSELYADLWNTILSGKTWHGELQNRKKNGEHYWETASISPIINEQQNITHFIAIKEDITERRLTEIERVRQAGLIESLLDSIPDIIFFKDTEGNYLGCNPSFVELTGKPKNEITGQDDCSLFDRESAALFMLHDHEVLREQKPYHSEGWVRYPDGRKVLIDILKTPYFSGDGSLIGILGISRDITRRKQAEEAVLKSSQKFEAIILASPDGIGMISLDGKIQLLSDKLAMMYGYSVEQKDEYLGTSFISFIDPSHHELLHNNIHKLLNRELGSKITEYLAIKKDQSRFYVDVNSTVLYDSYGNPESILFIERDITERKKAAELLENERTLFRTIIDLLPDAVYVKDSAGRKIIANPREVAFTGMASEGEILGKTDFELHPDQEAVKAFNEDQFVLTTGNPIFDIEGTLVDKDGKFHWLLCSKVPLRDIHGKITGIVGVSHDITERKNAEEALAQAANRLAIATKAGGVGIWDYDIVHKKLFWDNQMYKIYGISPDISIDAYEAWRAGVHPDDQDQDDHDIEMAIRGEKEFDTEFRVLWPDGSIHNVRSLAFVVRNESGAPLRMIGTNWDITDQKKTEAILLKAKEEADIASKAKSEFLANMSHEIRTPLNGVIGFTELLLNTPLNKTQLQYAKNVRISGHSLLGIISDILDFSKIEAGKMELDHIQTDLIELIEQTSDIIKYNASQKGIELLLDIQHDMPQFIFTDPVRLKQVLVNLLGNAVKFTSSGEVELKMKFTPKNKITGDFNFSVRDTGIGIDKEHQTKLFNAFIQADTSTTRKFGGTGLGLTISSMLVEKMGSKIELISEPGKGSTFFFTIEAEYKTGDETDFSSLEDIKRILVIDDNDNNRMILEHTLNNWGIEFTGTDSGLSGLKIIENSKPFDVIIVDYHMPEYNGIDTIRMIRERLNISPEKQPTILLHSSSDNIDIYDKCKQLGVKFYLTKPVKAHELMQYLKNIHNRSAAPLKEHSDVMPNPIAGITNGLPILILVAEDVVLNMVLITTLLRQMLPNSTVLEAKNGKEAVEMSVIHRPALIFMDVQMPEMSGTEATIKIREHEKMTGNHVPIIALTAGAIKGEMEHCLQAGMDDFLTKPIDRDTLQKIIKNHLQLIQTPAAAITPPPQPPPREPPHRGNKTS
jgi:PAS domain S-box-containing protein